jgi:TRAP transporter TAXI family solute receptor
LEILSGGNAVALGFATGLADQLNKNHPWIRSSVTQVGGDEDTLIQSVDKDPTTLHSPNSFNYWGAFRGVAGWTKSYPNIRLISAHLLKSMNMWSNDPNIRTLEDLKGKKVVGLTGSVSTAMLEGMLEELGIRDEVELETLGYGAQFDSFRDHLTVNVLDTLTIDATTNTGHVGGFMEQALFALGGEVYTVEYPPELIKKASDKLGMGYAALENPPGTLETQDAPWHGMYHGGNNTIATREGADEEVIYEVTKMWIEGLVESGKLADYHPFGAYVTTESIMTGLPILSEDEMHPGALRYYKESGLWDMWPGPWGS